jgi:hypothetical protein
MIHLVTGEVLRVFYNQKEAANMLGVSQAGLSQCCSGVKPDAYGFKWRFYEGPAINCKFELQLFLLIFYFTFLLFYFSLQIFAYFPIFL